MTPLVRALLAALACLVATAPGALAGTRYALVIGNDAYREVVPLENAVADATAVADRLAGLGYEVYRYLDADRERTERALDEFVGRVAPGDEAVFFFAGHGIEIDGLNYLLPVDVPNPPRGDGEAVVRGVALSLNAALARLSDTGARAAIAIIDACRDNPLEPGIASGVGLANIAAPEGTFVVFSASAGQLAYDTLFEGDPDPNSVFTRYLLPLLDEPGLDLRTLTVTLRRRVATAARQYGLEQVPAYFDALLGEVALAPAGHRVRVRPQVDVFEPDPFGPDVHAPVADPVVMLSRREVAQVQHRLHRLGYRVGAIDGVLGRHTRRAIAAWQRDQHRPATGRLTMSELDALLGHRVPRMVKRPLPAPLAPMRRPGAFAGAGGYIDALGCARRPDGTLIFCPASRYAARPWWR